jgi:hypothetical protein
VDANVTYAGLQAESVQRVYAELGLGGKLSARAKAELDQAAAALRHV